MTLSESLKREFAKMANASVESEVSTLYGMAKVDSGGNISVLIDGAEMQTPAISVVDVYDGDKVTLVINNHQAIITGNVSTPVDAAKELLREYIALVGAHVDYGETETTFYRNGQKKLSITDLGITFYHTIENTLYELAKYTGNGIILYHPTTHDPVVAIDANGASFTGSVYASGGRIGGWDIGSDSLSRTTAGYGGVYLEAQGLSVINSGWETLYRKGSIQVNNPLDPDYKNILEWGVSSTGNTSLRSRNQTYIYNGNGAGVFMSNNDNFRPTDDNSSSCGSSAGRWSAVYAVNTSIQTSDRKEKDNITPIGFSKELILGLEPVTYMWKDGDHRRKRMGFIAQDVANLCKELNENLSLVTASYIQESDTDTPNNDYFGEEVDDELLRWGMSVEQLIAPLVALVQQQEERISELERRL